ncbi:hypothetical protein O181_054629 [Austropuccinia psidii MF-1]|uniref:Uncharacterized protein n=1 Tax=Austropuccinia psidii MF-1 TaxID=1389203 RepID=A0A9Q3HTU8_9BASI|nr:hypothetical protein [Austropuccinia psidii MF-1]
MSHVHLRKLGLQRNQQENRPGFVRVRRLGSGNHGHHNKWKDSEVNHTHIAIHPSIQWEPQTRGLEGYGSSPSAPPTPQISIPMENGQQEVHPNFTLGRTGMILPEGISKRDTLQRSYGNNQRIESQQEVQTSGEKGSQDKGE